MTDEMGYLLEQQEKKIAELSARINRQEKYHEELLNLIRTLTQEKAVMLEALESINYLINNSTGVAGWHLNGAIEPWERTEVAQDISDAIAVAKESPEVRDEIIRKARGEDA